MARLFEETIKVLGKKWVLFMPFGFLKNFEQFCLRKIVVNEGNCLTITCIVFRITL